MGVLILKSLATVINESQQIIQNNDPPNPVNGPLVLTTTFVTFTCCKRVCYIELSRTMRGFHSYIDISALIQGEIQILNLKRHSFQLGTGEVLKRRVHVVSDHSELD